MSLEGKSIAILIADGFEQVEMTEPRSALEDAGAITKIVSPERLEVQGWNHDEKAGTFKVDIPLDEARAEDFDGLLLPGGVRNPDRLRMIPATTRFVQGFLNAGKPIAAICHAPWTLIEAKAVKGRTITSWPSLKTDLLNAGANWVDEEVVVDNGLVSSRKPDDIPAFIQKMIEEFGEGRHQQRSQGASGFRNS